jgi:hypothetical protein
MWTTILLIYMMYSIGHYVDCYFVDLHDVIHLRNEFICFCLWMGYPSEKK